MAEGYVIRADGNSNIGAGHLMRCLTIAGELKECIGPGDKIIFVCADKDGASLVENRGFTACCLDTAYDRMDAETASLEQAFHQIAKDGLKLKWILVDSYYITDEYVAFLSRFAKVAVMDDLAEKPRRSDLVINYNLYAKEAYENMPGKEILKETLLGAAYVPLRRQFQGCVKNEKLSDGQSPREGQKHQVENVLITTGGADQDNIGGRILEKLAVKYDTIKFHLVAGRYHPQIRWLWALADERENIEIHVDVQDMASLMKQCDLSITAGGTTIYELCAMGVPLVCFSYAKNQEQLCAYMEKLVGNCYAGEWHKNQPKTMEKLCEIFEQMYENEDLRKQAGIKQTLAVDGMGAGRIAKRLAE